ncbi:hypothetical protein DLAC_10038 [Tieghemostelium lacteum]|uniref:FNIP repeat-containing protein n=1 Tax=Tieghemostelium lacteum TaxID=361077 RepID=A0A151Z613_TIELA|nr:hypothetical protein DLAC_10038 [Tieghemostelium lacteum]|eukprot:KYQ89377.1 hypothetical protein DLAC_10038 [Tieghemostelium lacteum]
MFSIYIWNRIDNRKYISHFFTMIEIIKHLKTNRDIIQFISICKSTYSFRNSIRYYNYPINYCQEFSKLSPLNSSFKLPPKFTTLIINNEEHFEYIRPSLSSLDILDLIFHYFNQTIDHWKSILPNTIRSLIFECPFNLNNNNIDNNSYPESLIKINFGNVYNQIIDNFNYNRLPCNLVELYLGDSFNSAIHFPSSLKKLIFGKSYDLELEIPNHIEILGLGKSVLRKGDIPTSVKHLILNGSIERIEKGILPNSITTLDINTDHCNVEFTIGSIPTSVEYLSFLKPKQTTKFTRSLKPHIIPSSVKHLQLVAVPSNNLEKGSIPMGVQKLYLDLSSFTIDRDIDSNIIPPSVKHCEIICQKTYPLEFPNSIKRLKIRYSSYVDLVPGQIPNSVQSLTIDFSYGLNFPSMVANIWPSNLEKMKLNGPIILSTPICIFPSSLKSLSVKQLHGVLNLVQNGLPPNLETLIIKETVYTLNEFPIAKLPKSLKVLKLGHSTGGHSVWTRMQPHFQTLFFLLLIFIFIYKLIFI